MKPYVIKQGDYLLKLGHTLGFDAEAVWNDGKNAELKALRKDADMLQAGDILFVPDEPRKGLRITAEESNRYVAKVPRVKVSVVVTEDDEPVAHEKYVVLGLGEGSEEEVHETDGDGRVELEAPVHVRELTIRFVDRPIVMKVGVGDLDPADTDAGVRMRLTQLGYYGAQLTGEEAYVAHDDRQLAGAVKAFQAAFGLSPTGKVDDATRAKLVSVHGS